MWHVDSHPDTLETTDLSTPDFSIISRFSLTAFGLPGRFRTKHFPITPHSAQERQANGVILRDSIMI